MVVVMGGGFIRNVYTTFFEKYVQYKTNP